MDSPKDRRRFALSADAARRVRNVVRRVESTPWSGDPRGRSQADRWNPGVARGKVTTAIPTGTFAAPSSSGRVQIYAKDATGAWVAWRDPVVIYNDHALSASIAVGKTVKAAWCAGDWYLVAADC